MQSKNSIHKLQDNYSRKQSIIQTYNFWQNPNNLFQIITKWTLIDLIIEFTGSEVCQINFHSLKKHQLKFSPLGPTAVGKTSLLLRLTQDSFNENYFATIGLDFLIKRMLISNEPVKLHLWDKAGAERISWTTVSKSYYRGAHGIIFAFDISSGQSFQEVQKIYNFIMNEMKNMDQNTSCILVGCKSDLENKREISYNRAMAFFFAESFGMNYFETSAKSSRNCLEAVQFLTKICLEQINKSQIKDVNAVILTKPKLNQLKKYSCC